MFKRLGDPYRTYHRLNRTGHVGGESYLRRLLNIRRDNQIQHLVLDEPVGRTAFDKSPKGNNGLYANAGITYKNYSVGGALVPTYNGNNTYVDMVDSAGNTFPTDWNGNSYSAICWGVVDSAARWTDAATFRYLWHVRDGFDSTYYTIMGKNTTNHQIEWRRRTGGAIVSLTYTFAPTGTLNPFCMGIVHLQSAPYMRAYLYAENEFIEVGESTSVNLGDWGNHPPTDGTSVLFAGSLTLQEWIGSGGIAITWDAPLTTEEMKNAMVPYSW